MGLTIFTFLTTQLLTSIFIAVLIPLCKNNRFICRFGIYFALAPLLACILRFMLPVETSFTVVLPSYNVLTAVYSFGKRLAQNYNISLLLLGAWLTGSLFLTVILIKDIIKLKKLPRNSSNVRYIPIHNALCQVVALRGYKHNPKIIVTDFVSTPFVFGYKEPIIYIPNISYNETQLFYTLDHELAHWHNGDLWIKLFVQVICIVYWWNPIIYLLRDILSQSLEIKCDSFICQNLNLNQKTEYLKTIIHTLENTPETRINNALVTSNFVSYISDDNAITQRFELVYKYNFNVKKGKAVPIFSSMIIFLLTYSIVIQPVYFSDGSHYFEQEEGYVVESATSYIIANDSVYYLHTEGEEPLEITESQCDVFLESGIKIINK